LVRNNGKTSGQKLQPPRAIQEGGIHLSRLGARKGEKANTMNAKGKGQRHYKNDYKKLKTASKRDGKPPRNLKEASDTVGRMLGRPITDQRVARSMSQTGKERSLTAHRG